MLERNWGTREGEIDIIASKGEDLVFVEVRSRQGRNFGTPEESITGRKASTYVAPSANMQQHPAPQNIRTTPWSSS